MDDGSPDPFAQQGLDAVAADAIRAVFPNGLPPARSTGANPFVSSFSLTEKHLAELAAHITAGKSVNSEQFQLTRVSRRHHRLAQLLSMGMDNGRAAVIVGMHKDRVSILRSDPMFMELMEFYSHQIEEEFRDVVGQMADFSEDVLGELRRRLEDSPEQFTVTALNDLFKTFADRTGNGPTSNQNIRSVSVTLPPDELKRIMDGKAASHSDERPLPVLSAAHRSTIEGVFAVTAADVAGTNGTEGQPEGNGVRVREEGSGSPAEDVPATPVALPRVDQL